MSKIDLVIFDFDGTLVDTAPDLIRAANLFLKSQGLKPLPEARIRNSIGMGLSKLLLQVYPNIHSASDEQKRKLFEDFIAVYEKEYLINPVLYPGASQFLNEWDGHIAIVSNKRSRFIHPILEKLQIHLYPWVSIVGGDSYANMKPHPEPFLAAIAAAGTTPEHTLIVGDGIPDVQGALAIGSPCVAVAFGYHPVEELVEFGATKTIEHFDELLPLLE